MRWSEDEVLHSIFGWRIDSGLLQDCILTIYTCAVKRALWQSFCQSAMFKKQRTFCDGFRHGKPNA